MVENAEVATGTASRDTAPCEIIEMETPSGKVQPVNMSGAQPLETANLGVSATRLSGVVLPPENLNADQPDSANLQTLLQKAGSRTRPNPPHRPTRRFQNRPSG
jgi:hypothetical protein